MTCFTPLHSCNMTLHHIIQVSIVGYLFTICRIDTPLAFEVSGYNLTNRITAGDRTFAIYPRWANNYCIHPLLYKLLHFQFCQVLSALVMDRKACNARVFFSHWIFKCRTYYAAGGGMHYLTNTCF